MKTVSLTLFCLGCFLIIGIFQEPRSLAQDFPYSVPQAPEFDRRGNHIESGPESEDNYAPPKRSRHHSRHRSHDDQADLRSVRPYAPNGPQPMAAPPQPHPAVPPTSYAARQAPQPRQIQTPPPQSAPQPPPTPQGRPDCSRYPMMIAQARSEGEMRAVAQMYLSCLLKSGWNMEQARNHVIMTIETTYRAGR